MNNHNYTDEIDLGQFLRSVKNRINRLQGKLFDFLLLVVKYKVILISILIIGFAIGLYLDTQKTSLKRAEVVVIPNYNSSDFLYRNIENLSSLLSKGSNKEIEHIFGEKFKKIKSLSISPIYDIQPLINSKELMDILKESVKDNRLDWIHEEFQKGRIQKYHSIEILSEEDTDALSITHKLIDFLNDNDFYKQIRLISLENVGFQLEELDRTLIQIDSVISAATSKKTISTPTSQGFLVNDNSHISSLIEYKYVLIEERFEKLRQIKQKDDVIQLVSIDTNTEIKQNLLFSNLKITLPIILIATFLLVIILISYIKHISKFSSLNNKKED